MYEIFKTNAGLCWSFETKNDIIYRTSDIKDMHDNVFTSGEGGSEIYIGRIVNLNDISYRVIEIRSNSDLQYGLTYADLMSGTKYNYSHVLRIFVELA